MLTLVLSLRARSQFETDKNLIAPPPSDPKAQVILDRMTRAYANVSTLKLTLCEGTPGHARPIGRLFYQGRTSALVRLLPGPFSRRSTVDYWLQDGKILATSTDDPGFYLRTRPKSGESPLDALARVSRILPAELASCLEGRGLESGPWTLGEPTRSAGGAPADTLIRVYDFWDRTAAHRVHQERQATIVGSRDGLIRGFGNAIRTERGWIEDPRAVLFENVVVNGPLPMTLLRFQPPKGARRTEDPVAFRVD